MRKMFKFWRESAGETIEDANHFSVYCTGFPEDYEWFAEQYADHFYNDLDGHESKWPITFGIGDLDGNVLALVEVRKIQSLEFYGKKKGGG